MTELLTEDLAVKDFLRIYSFEPDNLQFGVFPENQHLINDPTGITRHILERSFESKPMRVIAGELEELGYTPEVIRQAVARLRELDILGTNGHRGGRYERQERFFEIFKDGFLPGSVYQESLRASRLLVLGLTAVGSRIFHLLANGGVGAVTAVDGRPVAPQDVSHQHVFTHDSVGRPRAQAWMRLRERLNPECEVLALDGFDALPPPEMGRFDLCLLCDPEQFSAAEVIRRCTEAGVPYMLFGVLGGRGFLDPLYIPGRTPCPECLRSPLLYPETMALSAAPVPLPPALVAASVADVAALQTLKLLSGFTRSNNLHQRILIDLAAFDVSFEEPGLTRLCAGCRPKAETVLEPVAAEGAVGEAGSGEDEETILEGRADLDSRLELYPLVESREGEDFILGREDTGTFISVGELERKFLRLLEQGMSLRRAREAFGRHFQIPDLKIASFIDTLRESGFLRRVDGFPLDKEPQEKRFHLAWLKPRHVAFLFSRPALALYVLVALGALALCFQNPDYLPHYRDVFFLPSVSLSLILNALFGWFLLVPHEFLHLAAAKSLGCDSHISLGHRMMFVVVQTDVTNIWKVPRHRRHIVYLAGMIAEVMIGSAAVYAMWLADRGVLALHPYVYAFLGSAVYVVTFKIAWNFLFYMRTDIYYFVANVLQCKNLYQDTVTFLRNELAREVGWIRPVPADPIPEREQRFVRLYSLFFLVGTILTMAAFSVALLPLGLVFRNAIVAGFAGGLTDNGISFVDSAVASGLILLQLALLAYAVVTTRRKKRLVAR